MRWAPWHSREGHRLHLSSVFPEGAVEEKGPHRTLSALTVTVLDKVSGWHGGPVPKECLSDDFTGSQDSTLDKEQVCERTFWRGLLIVHLPGWSLEIGSNKINKISFLAFWSWISPQYRRKVSMMHKKPSPSLHSGALFPDSKGTSTPSLPHMDRDGVEVPEVTFYRPCHF